MAKVKGNDMKKVQSKRFFVVFTTFALAIAIMVSVTPQVFLI